MIINSARFKISSPSVDKAPQSELHEYAFIGRSNVGKSSLINMLTGKKGLAMTSATPGKTMLINHFLINDSWYIVDLPGYGFAARSKVDLARIDKMIKDYILYRPQMTTLFLLIDSRLEPQKIDLSFMEWLGENGIPFSIVFTKTDKMSRLASNRKIADYCAKLLEMWEELPPIFVTSSNNGTGRDELLNYIDQLNRLPLQQDLSSTSNDTTMEHNEKKQTTEDIKGQQDYPGAAIDTADGEKTTAQEVDERTETLNNNPRNNDL